MPATLRRFIAGEGLLANILLVVMTVGLLALFSNYNRPIWLDEFLQYAFAGFSSTGEAVAAIWKSIISQLRPDWRLHAT
jgi:hypothetical protein